MVWIKDTDGDLINLSRVDMIYIGLQTANKLECVKALRTLSEVDKYGDAEEVMYYLTDYIDPKEAREFLEDLLVRLNGNVD